MLQSTINCESLPRMFKKTQTHSTEFKLNTMYKCENNYTRNKSKSCEKSYESEINTKSTVLNLENLQIILQNQIFGAWECEIEWKQLFIFHVFNLHSH